MFENIQQKGVVQMTNISERIKQLRTDAGLTQEEFGNIFGIVKSTVSLYESGKSCPNDQMKLKIAEYFKVSVDYLLGNTDFKENVGVGHKDDHFYFFFFESDLKEVFTQRLNALLKRNGFTEEDLASMAGIDLEMVKRYLCGNQGPSIEELRRICSVLKTSSDYLLGFIDDQEEKLLSTFKDLNEDNQDIIVGDMKRYLKEQRRAAAVAEEANERKVVGK